MFLFLQHAWRCLCNNSVQTTISLSLSLLILPLVLVVNSSEPFTTICCYTCVNFFSLALLEETLFYSSLHLSAKSKPAPLFAFIYSRHRS